MSSHPVSLQHKAGVVPFSSRLKEARALKLDVWSIFNAANLPSDCINLSRGYMNFSPPDWVLEAAAESFKDVSANQYSHPKGRLRLRTAIKHFYEESLDQKLDVESEIIVTSGANEGQYSFFTAFLEQGDEVIVFEPFFDQYFPSVTFNGGKPVFIPLHPPKNNDLASSGNDWTVDFDELRRAITPRTKVILLNTPHNPIGKVFTRAELEIVATIAKEFNLLVMADEVYGCLVYDKQEHISIATLPGMWERTVTVGSAGKLFAATGWRVGWLIGPSTLILPTLAATMRIAYCTNSPLQEAVAAGLEQAKQRNFLTTQISQYEERRAVLASAFAQLGLKHTVPAGSYLILVDISTIDLPEDYVFPESIVGRGQGFKAAWFIAMEIGVSSIPIGESYSEEHSGIGEAYTRFAFCKDTETLARAAERLQGLKKYIRTQSPSAPVA